MRGFETMLGPVCHVGGLQSNGAATPSRNPALGIQDRRQASQTRRRTRRTQHPRQAGRQDGERQAGRQDRKQEKDKTRDANKTDGDKTGDERTRAADTASQP